mmetsp:Transcript_20620/g.52337  ORF Transcript_20620/g.52337 Transcript_20620/m.52337 type:complete len:414 (+) Transcript_20620:568-1809(+)
MGRQVAATWRTDCSQNTDCSHTSTRGWHTRHAQTCARACAKPRLLALVQISNLGVVATGHGRGVCAGWLLRATIRLLLLDGCGRTVVGIVHKEARGDLLELGVQRGVGGLERRGVLRPADKESSHAARDRRADHSREENSANYTHDNDDNERSDVDGLGLLGDRLVMRLGTDDGEVSEQAHNQAREDSAYEDTETHRLAREVHVDKTGEAAALYKLHRILRSGREVLAINRHLHERPVVKELEQGLDVTDDTRDAAHHQHGDQALLLAACVLNSVANELHKGHKERSEADGTERCRDRAPKGAKGRSAGHGVRHEVPGGHHACVGHVYHILDHLRRPVVGKREVEDEEFAERRDDDRIVRVALLINDRDPLAGLVEVPACAAQRNHPTELPNRGRDRREERSEVGARVRANDA